MLQPATRAYICPRCILRSTKRRIAAPSVSQPRPYRTSGPLLAAPRTNFVGGRGHSSSAVTSYGAGEKPVETQTTPNSQSHGGKPIPLYQQLQQWASQNPTTLADLNLGDALPQAGLLNVSFRDESTQPNNKVNQWMADDVSMTDVPLIMAGIQDPDPAVQNRSTTPPGALVEMNQATKRIPVLAVYVGLYGERHHFYTNHGRWICTIGFSPLFTVAKFANPSELDALLSKIPKDADPETYEDMRNNDAGPSKEDGALLIVKMSKFKKEAEAVYQSNISNLDGARALLSDQRRVKYLSLFEITEILVPQTRQNEQFPAPTLYAVHTALNRNEIAFRRLSPSSAAHRQDHVYEIFPSEHSAVIDRVAAMIRYHTEQGGNWVRLTRNMEGTALGNFVIKARQAVETSRQSRSYTPHGTLAPSPGTVLPSVDWSKSSREILLFIEWWASYGLFETSSVYNTYGSSILRALDLYPDLPLDRSTAWTFLQEIGHILPWEIPSRYRVRFPDTSIVPGGGLRRNDSFEVASSRRQDIAHGARKEWSEATVLCIDAPSTNVIDDGISLERTGRADEYWIHVHVADPASGIKPNSELCKFMELIPENIYLPGHFQAMLPAQMGDDTSDIQSESLISSYSLRPGQPALTFSAKVNDSGQVLDCTVQPGILRNVLYLDPADVSQFCGEPAPLSSRGRSLWVEGGNAQASKLSNESTRPATAPSMGATQVQPLKTQTRREMTKANDLEQPIKDDLLKLYALAEALRHHRLSKGAWPYFFPRPSVSVHIPKGEEQEASSGTITVPPDPSIRVSDEPSAVCSVVSHTMVLAGEVAAKWASSRGIPLPYRRDVNREAGQAPALEYAKSELYPLIEEGKEPSMTQRAKLSQLTGGAEISTDPGPYFTLGVDMYTKATSPLRRFSDLLVHWQIHAALAHERETKRRLDPATDKLDEILPFPGTELSKTVMLVQMREKMARAVSSGTQDWTLFALLRAWKYEGTAPKSLRFTVLSRLGVGVIGRLDYFGLSALMDVDGLDDRVLLLEIKSGEQFDVEIVDINVHARRITVRALEYYGKGRKPSVGGGTN